MNKKLPFTGYEDRHVVDYYLEFLHEFGIDSPKHELEFIISLDDMSWTNEFLVKNQIQDKGPIIGLVPGGGASWGKDAIYKRWPAERYAKLADKIIEKGDIRPQY